MANTTPGEDTPTGRTASTSVPGSSSLGKQKRCFMKERATLSTTLGHLRVVGEKRVAQEPAKAACGLLLPLLPDRWRYPERYRETRCFWMAAGLTSCKWEGPVLSAIIIFTISSALFVYYVVEVLRHVYCTSPDGQEPPPPAQTSLENDLSHRGPRGTGPMGYPGKVAIVFS
jgi:hypothetical protein